jgi:hypothetical protein
VRSAGSGAGAARTGALTAPEPTERGTIVTPAGSAAEVPEWEAAYAPAKAPAARTARRAIREAPPRLISR